MEPQETYIEQIQLLYSCSHQVRTKLATDLLKGIHKKPEELQKLLTDFSKCPIYLINIHDWCDVARMLNRAITKLKSKQLSLLLGDYYLNAAHYFFRYSFSSHNCQKLKPLLKITSQVNIRTPQNLTDQLHIILYLQNKEISEEWGNEFIQYILTQILVDKKNQTSALKMNPYFGKFISANFNRIMPQLERLMVRSQSNLEVIVEFLQSIKNFENIGEHAATLIKKYKNLFLTKSETSIRFVCALTSCLNTEEQYFLNFEIIKGLISNEHNSKKKIVYFRMLQGFAESIKKFKHSPKLANQLITLIAANWIKFIDQTETVYVFSILQNVLPLVTQPGPQIAQSCKLSLKSQNKTTLIFLGLTISEIYNKVEYIEEFGSVKQLFNTLKAQLDGYMKKKQANWQFILCIINFLSTFDAKILQNLSQIRFLFKSSCLALMKIQQSNTLKLLRKYFQYLQNEQEEGDCLEVTEELAVTTIILLEENRNTANIELFNWKNDQIIYQLLTKGVYPFIYLDIEKTGKNKGNRFVSLTRSLFRMLSNKISLTSQKGWQKLMTLNNYANLKFAAHIQTEINQDAILQISKMAEKYLKLKLHEEYSELDPKSEKIHVESRARDLIRNNIDTLVSLNSLDYFHNVFGNLLDKHNYEKNREWLEKFEENIITTMKEYIQQHKIIEEIMIEFDYYVQKKIPQKKIYLGTILDAKMMNQDEVKAEKYRQHFEKMLKYFEGSLNIVLKNIKNHSFMEQIWQKHFDQLIHIVTYPEHRLPIYKLVKASFQHINETGKLSKLFLKFSGFLAEFYAIRGAHLTPEISMMEKSQKFLTEFLDSDYITIPKDSFIIKFVNDLCLYVLENMQFDLSVKEQSIAFLKSAIQKDLHLDNIDEVFTFLVKNLNIISNNSDMPVVLETSMKKINPQRYTQLFVEILNYVRNTKRLILSTIVKINEVKIYDPSFQDYIKLRILSLDDSDEQISKSAQKILKNQNKNVKSISHFDMKNFITHNTKDTIQKLCRFMTEETNAQNIDDIFSLVLKTANQLYDARFDQEGLQFLPYFLGLNLDGIPEAYLHQIFELLVLKYTASVEFATLSRMSIDVGIDIIKKYAPKNAEKLLKVMESFLTETKGISNIVFLGVLAPYVKGNKNLNIIQSKITELFKGDNENDQIAIAKSMPDLMSFFKNAENIVQGIFNQINTLEQKNQSGQSYLFAGLLKGIGYKKTAVYLDKTLSKEYPSKTPSEKIGRCLLLRAFINIFGRVIELRALNVIERLLAYMSDSNEEVRRISKSVTQIFVTRMSSFGIKQLLPHLLSGLQNEQNWRVKISYIWILGIMANCAAKQLQTSLPIIVPTLSTCLSNAHPTIREKAAEALNLIGETIKNPEISQTIDILIEALENPFQKSEKAIELLLKTRFSHYIDPPSLSLIVPILDYCLRGRVSELKQGACQVLGSISELILNPSDILPYLKVVSLGIKTAICDPLPEIRSIAAMAIGKISAKIGADNAREYFTFIFELVDSHSSNTTQKTGAAQAYAEIICSQDFDYFEQSLNFIFTRLSQQKSVQKQGYILIFLFVPTIRRAQFEGFIKQVNENTYCYVSDEEEALRNSSMQVSKVLINNYGISHTELLLEPLCDGIFEQNWRKRNAALILLGQLLNILKSHMFHNKTNDKATALYQAMMAVYMMKDDDLQMPRATANQVWNMYIENTPKTIKSGLKDLVRMWTRFTHAANGVVFKNIIGFSGKYGENYLSDILDYLWEYSTDPLHKKGVFEVLGEFIKRMSQQFLSKQYYKTEMAKFFGSYIFTIQNANRGALTRCLALYVEKLHEETYFENLIYPQIDKMANLNEEDPLYTDMLHLIKDLLNTSSNKIVDRLISKVTTPPLSEFMIEVITNNADKIANNLYTLFKVPATQAMLQQIFTLLEKPEKKERLSLLIYCLNQVSIRLNKKYKNIYMNMIIRQMRSIAGGKKAYGVLAIDKIFDMLVFFLNSCPITQIEDLDQLIGQITPYIFKGTGAIKTNAHRIFMILISDTKSSQTGLYYRQLIVSLDNNKQSSEIWTDKEIVKDYINILVRGLAYGLNENMEDNLQMLRFLIKQTKKQIISPMIMRIVGPIIRVASYPLTRRQKEKVLELLTDIYCSGYNLEVYNHQVVSVCLRMLFQQRNSKKINEVQDLVTRTLFKVLETSAHRQILLNLIIHKMKAQGQHLIETMLQLLTQIIKENSKMFPMHSYEVLRHQFFTMLTNNDFKTSVSASYSLAKLCGMITCFMKTNTPQKLQSVNCTYEDILVNLHVMAFNKQAVPKVKKIQLLIKQSSRQKVYYLLKTLSECKMSNTRTQQVYSYEYVKSLVPEALSGFQDIIEVLQDFE